MDTKEIIEFIEDNTTGGNYLVVINYYVEDLLRYAPAELQNRAQRILSSAGVRSGAGRSMGIHIRSRHD
jgi:hypothetical protein